MTVREERPVLLVGAQRSGTTGLASVLERAFARSGGSFTINGRLPYLLDRWCRARDLAGRHLRAEEILCALHRKPPYGDGARAWTEQVGKVLARASSEVASGSWKDPDELCRWIVRESYGSVQRVGDKYNEYLLDLSVPRRMFDDPLIVLLVRDPSEVADSVLAWRGDRPWRPRTREDALDKWAAWHEPLMEDPLFQDTSRLYVADYARVCDGGLTGLGAFLGLDLDPYTDLLNRSPRSATGKLPPPVGDLWDRLQARVMVSSDA